MAYDQPGVPDGVYYGIAVALRRAFRDCESVFEVGCGTGRLSRHLDQLFWDQFSGCEPHEESARVAATAGYEWWYRWKDRDGDDPTCAPRDRTILIQPIESVDVGAAGESDLLVSWQVLEHLDPERVPAAMRAMSAICSGWQVHSIGLPFPEGEAQKDASHTCLLPRAWWLEHFAACGWEPDEQRAHVLRQHGRWKVKPGQFVMRRKR